nr:LysM peptidoglycan-binding domain-containing protein [Pseudoalteromonas sp. MM1]
MEFKYIRNKNGKGIHCKKGDTLWDISSKHLGSPMEWPRLWKFNN